MPVCPGAHRLVLQVLAEWEKVFAGGLALGLFVADEAVAFMLDIDLDLLFLRVV